MISYSRFLVKNILIKKGLYVTVALFTILMILITYLQAHEANSMNMPFIANITTFTKFFPFLISSLFTTLITVYVFKEGEEDGSELMVVSKPITRKVIVSTKFLVTLSFVIGFHFFAFIIYLISGVTDTIATTKMIVEFAGSLAVGGFAIQLIVLSIVTLIASVVGKVGTLITGTMLAAIIPILSFIVTPISNGIPVGARFLRERMFINANVVDSVDPSTLTEEQAVSMIDYKNIYNTRPNEDPKAIKEHAEDYGEYMSDLWYPSVAYGDIWYQWGRFMSIFTTSFSTKSIAVQKWDRVEKHIDYPTGSTMRVAMKLNGQEQTTIDYKNIAIYLNTEEMGIDGEHKDNYDIKKLFVELKDDLESLYNKGYISDDVFASEYPDQRPGHQPQDSDLNDSEKKTLKLLTTLVQSNSLSDKINHLNLGKNFGLLVRVKVYREINNFLKLKHVDLTSDMGIFDVDKIRVPYVFPEKLESNDPNYPQWIYDAGKPLSIYEPKPFIDTNSVIYAWLIIMGLLLGSTLVIYSKRDFK